MKNCVFAIFLLLSISVAAQTGLPDPPNFLSASVVPESSPTRVLLRWEPSTDNNVAGYIIYKVVDNITTTLDTVSDRSVGTYEYLTSSANGGSEKFRMAAFDYAGYKSSITQPHSTIYLTSAYDKCAQTTTLSWSPYVGWDNGIVNYRVYRRFSSSDFQLIKTLPPTATEYSDAGMVKGRWYCYYVEAVRYDGVNATSNSVSFTASGHEGPALMKANYASVDESQNINLYFQIVNAGQVVEYQLLRSESIDGDYVSIASFTYSGQSQIIFTDENVDASKNIYYYKLAAIDPCGSISKVSNIASNILLTVESDDVTDHSLDWSEYKEWTDGVFAYKIYSFVNGYSAEIGTNGPGSLSMVYDISSYVRRSHDKGFYLSDTFCYYVEAYENSSDASSQNVSRSNLACVNESPICWVPTAFNITSKSEANRVFKPILSFAKEDSYEFAIYNRWGQQVFLTNDITEGWTGRESKQYYHTDYYIYTVKYLDYKDKEYRKTGTFYLLME